VTDNVIINQPKTKGASVATDEIGGVQHQRVKLQYGADGTATDASLINPIPVRLPTATQDAFGRFRVSNPLTIFEVQHQYNTQPLVWSDSTSGGGTIAHLADQSSVRLRVGTASGDKVTRTTKRYFRYLPGKSQQIFMTGVMGAKKTGVVQRIGYFEDSDGMFFEQDADNLKVVIRSSASGSVVNTPVSQSSWNLDPLDGSGNSGKTLDISKAHIFVIDFQWLGVGRVRFGFDIDGVLVYCHEFLHANFVTMVYTQTANLPLRYEIENTSTSASNTDLIQICSAVISEGGLEREGYPFSAANGATGIAVTTRRPILSVRKSALFNTLTNHGHIVPTAFSVLSASENIFFEVVLGGTLTGPSWASVGSNSLAERDVAATAITGGQIVASGYVPANAQGNNTNSGLGEGLLSKQSLTNSDVLSIVITSVTGSSTLSYGSLNWEEIY